jgi:type IV pilus assembly protein PilC
MDALSFRQYEQLYHELAQFTRSGVTLGQAFELRSHNANDRIGTRLKAVRAHLQATGNLGRAFREAGFSESDVAIIQAGEASGRLDAVFLELGEFYRQLARARAAIIARSIYPVVVLHAGAVLLAIPPALLNGGWPAFFAQSLPILVGFYALLIFAAVLWRTIRGVLSHNVAAAGALLRVPGLGHFLSDWTIWKFASVLSLHVGVGGSLLSAFEAAAASCENALLRSATAHALALVQRGESLGEAFKDQLGVPEALWRSIAVGEYTGRLEEESARAAELFKNKALHALDVFAQWLPRFLYAVVVVFTAWRIIATVSDVTKFMESSLNVETY